MTATEKRCILNDPKDPMSRVVYHCDVAYRLQRDLKRAKAAERYDEIARLRELMQRHVAVCGLR